MHNDNKKLTAYLVLTGVLASQFVVNESVASAQGFLTNSEILLNKEGANSNETTNNLDYNAVEKVDLSKELEKDENTETEQKLTYEDIDESSIRAPKEELDSKELAKRLVISSFSFASVGAATGIIKHLVDSKNEQQNKKEDDPIPGPNQEGNTIPRLNQENNTIPRLNQEGNTIPRLNQENNTISRTNQEGNTIPRLNQEGNTIPRLNQEGNTIPRPNQEDNTIPRTNQENDPGNNFLKIVVIYTILLWLIGKFVIAPLYVPKVCSDKELFWLKLLTKLKVRPNKVKFIIDKIDEEGNLPGFIIDAAQNKLISPGDDKVITPENNDEFGIEQLEYLEVHGKKELFRLNLLTKLNLRPNKVKFIIDKIDDYGKPPNLIIEAAKKNLISLSDDEVIIPENKFVIAPPDVFKVYGNGELFWLNFLIENNVQPKKVEFIINKNEIDENGNLPAFIIEADKKNLISHVDEVTIPENEFSKFVIAPPDVLEVYGNGGLSWLNWLTERKVRPKKVKFIIEIDENDNPPTFIIEAAKKNLISPGDEVIIENNKDLERECANKILENCGYKIFLVDPEANVDPELDKTNYTGVLKVVSVRGLFEHYTDKDSNSKTNSLEKFKDFVHEFTRLSTLYVFRGLTVINGIFNEDTGIRSAIDAIIQSNKGTLINMSWTRLNREYCEKALDFLEEYKEIDKNYLKSRIDTTNLYKSILLKAGFGIKVKEGNQAFQPNGKDNPGGVEIFQMLLCMEKLLDGDDWKEFGLPVYKSLLIEFYYYSLFSPDKIKNEDNEKNNNWDEEIFKKLKELLEDNEKTVNKKGLLKKIEELKGFLKNVNYKVIDAIINPNKGDLIDKFWTKVERKYCEEALSFFEEGEKGINNDYIKSRIAATKLYKSILSKAEFGIKEGNEANEKSAPGDVEIFQMLICMENLLKEDNSEENLPAYNSLLIEFYYYSRYKQIKNKDKIGNNKWDKKVSEKFLKKVNKLKSNKESVSKNELLKEIEELKRFLLKINPNIVVEKLKKKVYESTLQNKGMNSEINTYDSNKELREAFLFENPYGL